MTLEEAHGYIEDMQRIMTQNRFIFSREAREAIGKAIAALEKQIPKEVENYPDEAAANSQPCKITDSDGNEIEKCVACGAEISPHSFELADTCIGEEYQVQILKCKNCGALSFGWHKAVE